MLFGPQSGITWAHVDDIIEGHMLALEKGEAGEAYIFAGPALTYQQAMQVWESITGVHAPRIWLPGWVAAMLAALSGLLERIGIRPPFSSEALREFADVTYFARSDKAMRELGWQARPVEDLFKETLEWFMAQRDNKK
jgi:dihydroflavonol-4-reductase